MGGGGLTLPQLPLLELLHFAVVDDGGSAGIPRGTNLERGLPRLVQLRDRDAGLLGDDLTVGAGHDPVAAKLVEHGVESMAVAECAFATDQEHALAAEQAVAFPHGGLVLRLSAHACSK